MTWKLQSLAFQCSHLFQRVASFLLRYPAECPVGYHFLVLISFREWLHSYSTPDSQIVQVSVSCSHLFQRVASFLHSPVVIVSAANVRCSHLFQRVASFLRPQLRKISVWAPVLFSSLSESGFIPTYVQNDLEAAILGVRSHLFQRVASFLQEKYYV